MIDQFVPVYSLGYVKTRTGLSARQIRYLEQKGLVTPTRIASTGHRVFSERDVERLLRIKGYLNSGYAREQLSVILTLEDDREKMN